MLTRPEQLLHRKIAVLGAGRTGLGVARFAARHGAAVTLYDEGPAERLAASLAELFSLSGGDPTRIATRFGKPFAQADLLAADLIVLSPGIALAHPLIAAAQQHGIEVTGEIELASRFIAAPIVAITGTNGKSTVTSLCGEIAAATSRPAFCGGNLGTPLIEAVGTDAASQHGIVVCEVSSYQLETAESFHPRAAAILNITPDHLDRHGSMQGYADAKFRIAANLGAGDVLVINQDDPLVIEAWTRHGGGRLATLGYSTLGHPRSGIGGFVDPGGQSGDTLVLRLAGDRGEIIEERYPASDLALVGRHNLGNALAAYLLLRGSNLATPDQIREGARRFRPLSHRMELVGERRGVRFYDDSKGTNVAAVVASIDGFPRPFVLIAGGRDKGGSYAPLRDALQRNITRAVVVIGEAADQIAAAVEGVTPVHRAASLEHAVALGASLAAAGDAVVLSPACSSYDMFRNYEHRGQAFRDAVAQLPPT